MSTTRPHKDEEPAGRTGQRPDIDSLATGTRLGHAQYRELLLFRTELRRFLRQSEQLARAAGLTPAQHQLLLAIEGHDNAAGPTIGETASYLMCRAHSVVQLVDRAAAADLCRRIPDGRDGRVIRLQLTDKGRRALGQLSGVHLEELRRLWLSFDPFRT